MKISHVAIWVNNLEAMKDFYVKYFQMTCNSKYKNPNKKFTSYFLSFKNVSAKIELMHQDDILPFKGEKGRFTGMAHLAISAGSRQEVDILTERLRSNGYNVVSEPRITGDGFYESVVKDCEGNLIEITE